MRLKSLEMAGFKSFSERTLLNFTPDISAIVGPNGCGKSNIVDAMRWVMGEQSARHLRGHQMEDVIFNGSEAIPGTGMAEVSLTFENDGRGPVEYSGFSEIVVTRRLFRSGESEYSINKVACRLKDIIDLFLGTGVGSKAYSIVEQGRVEEMVNAKPEDRRAIIEEAAGTSKYRSRRLAAERKLERTRQNLLRVSDIVREVERQIRSIELQAKRAERYRALREELKEKELSWAMRQKRGLEHEISGCEGRLQAVEDRFAQLAASLHAREAEIEKGKHDLLAADRGVSLLQETLYQRKVEIRGEEQKLHFYQRDLKELEDAGQKARGEILDMEARLQAVSLEIEGLKKAGDEFLQLSLFESEFLRRKESQLEEIRRQGQRVQSEIERGKEELVGLLNQLSQLRNELAAKDKRRVEITEELSRNQREQIEATLTLQGWQEKREEKRSLLGQGLARAREIEAELAESSDHLRNWSRVKQENDKRLESLKEQLQEARSRLGSLETLQKNYEGYHEGVRAIMLKRQGDAVFHGVSGLVADVIEAPQRFEKALTAVLGDRLQYIIVQSHRDGVEAIEYLKRESAGRGSFIPRHLTLNGNRSSPVARTGIVAPLLDMVSVKEGYQEIAEYLIGDVAVVQDLRSGLELWSRNGFSNTLVTLDGEVIDPMGVVTGGSSDGLEQSLLSQKRRIKELASRVLELEEQVRCEERQVGELRERIDQVEARRSVLTEEGHRLEVERVQLEHALLQADQEAHRLEEALKIYAQERADLSLNLQSLEGSRQKDQSEMEARHREKLERERALVAMREELSRHDEELRHLEAELTESRIRAATLSEKKESARLNLENCVRFSDDLSSRIRSRGLQVEEISRKRVGIIEAASRAEGSLAENRKALKELEESMEGERRRYRDISHCLTEREEALRDLRSSVETLQEERNRLQLSLSERKLNLQHLFESIREKYALELAEVSPEGVEEGSSGGALTEEIEELKGRLDRLGEVNLTAISEFEDLNARYQFLTRQKQDLEKSMADLQRTIAKLNRFCRMRFKESFEEINQKFQEIFAHLFSGGKARLVLTDENDYLETGVEIVARPPGKKLQSITLLSGGEKALTAVSLLFAIFSIKPSPFCFLDEVDAPLDDANIDRFLDLVRTMCRSSQFILITHNKRTMQAAEVLYGVTMSEPGVSKVVSVRMN